MALSRIDELRQRIAAIGREQLRYYQFFRPFADELERELGTYLGDPACVALSSADGDFSFDNGSYRHEGLGITEGRFRIPVMFRFRNLRDEGDFQLRLILYCTLQGNNVVCEISRAGPITLKPNERTPLHEYILHHINDFFSQSRWFDVSRSGYQDTGMGFTVRSSAG